MDRDQGCPRTMRMTTGRRVAWCVAVAALASAACGQLPGAPRAQGETLREICDPHTGDRWLLVPNDEVPGGPGRLILAAAERDTASGALAQPLKLARRANPTNETHLLPVIRAGDRLIVEEHTAVADAVLEARALNPAALGSTFNVRLKIGGKVLRAVALGPGRAALEAEKGVRP